MNGEDDRDDGEVHLLREGNQDIGINNMYYMDYRNMDVLNVDNKDHDICKDIVVKDQKVCKNKDYVKVLYQEPFYIYEEKNKDMDQIDDEKNEREN